MAGILPVTGDSRESIRTKITTSLHPSEIKESQTLPFLKEDVFTDTILMIDGQKIYTHRSLLGYASPYFTKLLNQAHSAALAEKKSKAELKIADKNYADFVDLFSFFHPGVCRELNEKMALRLLPLADEYQMVALKDRCEKLLVNILKTTPLSKMYKGPSLSRNRRDNPPDILLKYTKAADHGNSKLLSDLCVKMFSNPEVPLRDLKITNDISDTTKSKIFETRMDTASTKLSKVANELDKEKHEKEMLKKQLSDKFTQKRGMAMPKFGKETYIEEDVPTTKYVTGAKTSHKHQHNYLSHQRQIKYAENILGPVHEFSRDELKDGMSHRSIIRSDKGDI